MTKAHDFWSRRRAAVEAEAEAEATSREEASDAAERARLEGLSDSEVLEALHLPEPESLKAGDDFSPYLTRLVPEPLKRRALRALWRTNPVLANVDGLVDYGGDFTDSATVVENLKTAYTVGKGMLAHVERMAQAEQSERAPKPAEDAVERDPEPRDEPPADPAPVAMSEDEDEIESSEAAPVPRRMVFTYEDDRE